MKNTVFLAALFLSFSAIAAEDIAEMTDVQTRILEKKCEADKVADLTAPISIMRCAILNHENRLDAEENIEELIDERISIMEGESAVLMPEAILVAYNRDTGEYWGEVLRPYLSSNAFVVSETINGETAYILDDSATHAFYHMDNGCSDIGYTTASFPFNWGSTFKDATFIVKHHGDRDSPHYVYKLDRSLDPLTTHIAYHYNSDGVCQEAYNPRGNIYDFYPIVYHEPYEIKRSTYKYVAELPE